MEEKLLNHTPIFDLVEKHDDGRIGFNPVGVNSPEWVTVIVESDNQWLMVRQLRYGLMKYCEEFCCGMVETGEDPRVAARRELREETGYEIPLNQIAYLGKFAANPAFMNNYMHYFYVNLDSVEYNKLSPEFDEHEKLQTYWKDKKLVKADFLNSNGSVFMAGAMSLMNLYNII